MRAKKDRLETARLGWPGAGLWRRGESFADFSRRNERALCSPGILESAAAALAAGETRLCYQRCEGLLRAKTATAEQYGRLAALYRNLGQLEKTARALDYAVRLDDRLSAWNLEIGEILERLGRYEAAKKYYARSPRSGEALLRLCRHHLRRGELTSAATLLGKLEGTARSRPEALVLDGAVKVLKGECSQAVGILDRALTDGRDNQEAYVWRAEAKRMLRRLEEAGRDAEKAVAMGGNCLAARVTRAIIRLERGQTVLGAEYGAIQKYLPGPLAASAGLLSEGDPKGSLAVLEGIAQSLQGNRTNALTFRLPSGRLARPGFLNPRERMKAVQAGLALRPPAKVLAELGEGAKRAQDEAEEAAWLVHRGEVLLWLGEYRRALEDVSRGLPFPGARWSKVGVAGAQLMLGDHRAALKYLDLAEEIGIPPKVWKIWRGEVHRRMGNHRKAKADLESIPPSTRSFPLWINLALALGDAKDYRGQREIFLQLFDRSPRFLADAAIQRGLGDKKPAAGLSNDDIRACLGEALDMMRGNRSNWMSTYAAAPGRLRVISLSYSGYMP